jgi:two-component system, chemotaxis family, protein-glutamate methylesterase/glutaminase
MSIESVDTPQGTNASPPRPNDAGSSAQTRDIFAIGASAGGVPSLRQLVAALPADFPGTIFAVIHMSPKARSQLAEILGRAGPLPVDAPKDNAPIAPSRIYVASPNCHMLLERDRVRIVRGPKENRHRPAIDPLFRSAAWAYGPRAVGIVLTGYLDDGAAGLWAIKSCGGTTIVQDPADALHPDMPQNALLHNQVDYCVPLDRMAPLMGRIVREPVDTSHAYPKPATIKTEVEFAKMDRDIDAMGSLGKLSPFTCPSCRGALWELQEQDLLRYRCHTGHAFTGDSLLAEQSIAIEEGLYSALRAVEEKATALRRLGGQWAERFPSVEAEYREKARAMEKSADLLRRLLAERET